MAMVVKNNMAAVRTLNTLNSNSSALQKSLAKVSSGMKINSAQDDASGYAISERMRVQIRALDQANQNTQNGSSMMKTAEGAVSSTIEILKTLKEKAINAATDTNTDDDRKTIQKEIDQFIDQIDDNALVTFNGKYLVEGSKAQAGDATYTAITNQSLAKDTNGADTLVSLKNRKGESLEISSTDKVTASFVKDGQTYSTTYTVGNSTLEDIFSNLNGLDAGRVFGPANLMEITDVTTATATTQITNDTTGEGKLISVMKGGKTADDIKTSKSARVLAENDLIGSDSTTSYVYNTGKAIEFLKNDIQKTLEATKLKSSASTGTVSASFTFTVYDDTGASDTKTYTFSTNSTTDKGLGELDPALVKNMANDLGNSIQNLAKFSFDSDTAAGQFFIDSNGGNNASLSTAINNSLKATITTARVSSTATTPNETPTLTVATASTTDGSVNGGGIATAVSGSAVTNQAGAAYAPSSLAATYITEGYLPLAGGTTPTLSVNYAVAYLTSVAGGSLVHSGNDIGLSAANDMTYTADNEKGLTVTALKSGLSNQISGLNISISNSEGQVKKTTNEFLNAFKTTIFAANKSEDYSLKLHVGAGASQSISVGLSDMRAEALGLKGSDGSTIQVTTQERANAAVSALDNALAKALDQQTTIGAIEARLEYTSSNLTTSAENTQAAESSIRDADMAKEMTTYTKNNVLLQAAQSMLAQANQNASAVLSLLQ